MSIAIIGGLDRLKLSYKNQGTRMGFKVRHFGRRVPDMGKRLSGVDGIIVFTGTVAHNMVEEAVSAAKQNKIPIRWSHSSSVSGLKRSLSGFASR